MSLVELTALTKTFGEVVAVDAISLSIGEGEFAAFLGPSGCGKTTTLRMIAGLEVPDRGEIVVAGRAFFSAEKGILIPPQRRNVGMVFQSYALWPHMTVFENVAFGLRVQKKRKDEIRREVENALSYMQLSTLDRRYPHELSGGQQQRVSLARMIVARPSVFLMDEPLSNLDAKLRTEMRAEIKRLHSDLHATTIYVTHDQLEALTLASRVVVMKDGTIQQDASPGEVYERPANLFVAQFVGSPPINVIPGDLVAEGETVFLSALGSLIPTGLPLSCAGQQVVAAVRPEDILMADCAGPGVPLEEGIIMETKLRSVFPAGRDSTIHVEVGGQSLTLIYGKGFHFSPGDCLHVLLTSRSMTFYCATSGAALAAREP